jgi:hypothetical protein
MRYYVDIEIEHSRGANMETKDAFKEDGGKNNPIKNFCWPLSGTS